MTIKIVGLLLAVGIAGVGQMFQLNPTLPGQGEQWDVVDKFTVQSQVTLSIPAPVQQLMIQKGIPVPAGNQDQHEFLFERRLKIVKWVNGEKPSLDLTIRKMNDNSGPEIPATTNTSFTLDCEHDLFVASMQPVTDPSTKELLQRECIRLMGLLERAKIFATHTVGSPFTVKPLSLPPEMSSLDVPQWTATLSALPSAPDNVATFSLTGQPSDNTQPQFSGILRVSPDGLIIEVDVSRQKNDTQKLPDGNQIQSSGKMKVVSAETMIKIPLAGEGGPP